MGYGPSSLPVFAVVYDVGENRSGSPEVDPSDGLEYMPDIWDDYCGSRCHRPSIYLASEVLNPQSCLHLATQRFSKSGLSLPLTQ